MVISAPLGKGAEEKMPKQTLPLRKKCLTLKENKTKVNSYALDYLGLLKVCYVTQTQYNEPLLNELVGVTSAILCLSNSNIYGNVPQSQ